MEKAIIGVVSLIIWLWQVMVLWRKYYISKYREQLFKIRHELFLLPLEYKGKIGYEDELYKYFEAVINSLLWYCENISFYDVLMLNWIVKKERIKVENKLEKMLKRYKKRDKILYKKLGEMHNRINYELIIHIIYMSPVITVLYILVKMFAKVFTNKAFYERAKGYLNERIDLYQEQRVKLGTT